MRSAITLAMMLLLAQAAIGATIEGKVYDFSLEETEAIVTINTTPQQKVVAKGEYRFQVRPGNYRLTAESAEKDGATEEDISITEQGEYTIDLILFPEVDLNGSLDIDEAAPTSESFEYGNDKETWTYGLIIMILFTLLTAAYFYYSKQAEEKEMDPASKAIYDFIKSEKRTTQKEIRKEFPHSQAKISLILTELEEKELIKKVKKGRGNVIILN